MSLVVKLNRFKILKCKNEKFARVGFRGVNKYSQLLLTEDDIIVVDQRFEWMVLRPIDPGEVVTVHLMTRSRWGSPKILGVYRLGLQIIVNDGQIAITDSLLDDRNKPVPILCTLSFLANGSYQKIIKENIRTYLSQPSASRCINEVVEAFNNPVMVKKYIRFPQNRQERQMLKERFYKKFGFPAALGCVDGTLVALKKPVENEERFYCRKGYHARNVQLITDADLNILNVDPTYGGVTHDSFIFNYSDIKAHLEALTNAGEEVILLGDSGYAQRAYLMTPISGAEENSPEAFYNDRHITAHNSVERTIGLLKGRFRCLLVHRVLNYHPDIVAKIVIACCVLHNMCNRSGMPAVTISEEERLEELQTIAEVQRRQTRDLPSNTVLALGQLRRRNLVDMLWRSRHN